jgi:hypothetical protein
LQNPLTCGGSHPGGEDGEKPTWRGKAPPHQYSTNLPALCQPEMDTAVGKTDLSRFVLANSSGISPGSAWEFLLSQAITRRRS